jgi:hypothetical protein
MSNAYGCKRANNRIPKTYHPFMKKLGIRDVYEVPIRTKGMTSSGQMNQCHTNVAKLQVVYGGKVASGFLLHRKKERLKQGKYVSGERKWFSSVEWSFNPHSVWMTPEGKLVDVTQQRKELDVRTSTLFAPLQFSDARKHHWYFVIDYYLSKKYKKKGIWMTTSRFSREEAESIAKQNPGIVITPSVTGTSTRMRWLGDYSCIEGAIEQDRFEYPHPYFTDEVCGLDIDNRLGGFTEPSTATGKSWDEIWRRTCETL